MFNLNADQGRIVRTTATVAGGFWLCNQIADTSLMERVWHQLTLLTLGIGALRVWRLEASKPSHET